MSASKTAIAIADVMNGDVLVYFLNGESVLFRSSFLWANRAQDGNIEIPNQAVDEDEVFIVPDEPR